MASTATAVAFLLIVAAISFFVWIKLAKKRRGLLGNLKGITSDLVASECVLKLLNEGQIEFINKSEPQHLTQFAAHFISNTDQAQSCNFATFLPIKEDTPLQVSSFNRNLNSAKFQSSIFGIVVPGRNLRMRRWLM